MTPFRWILLNAFIWSFGAGLIKARIDWEKAEAAQKPVTPYDQMFQGTTDPNLPHVEPKYAEESGDERKPSTQPADQEFPKPPPFKLFVKGERITCIYDGIFSWSDGNEFVKPIAMDCTVVTPSEGWNDDLFGDNYQHIEVDCSKGLERKWTSQPGVGMVKNHPLNFRKRWFTSRECYHFVTED